MIDENADFVMLTVRNERPVWLSASTYSSFPMRANEWIAFAKTESKIPIFINKLNKRSKL